MSERPYLFPTPGRVLRGLLDLKAQLGEQFRDDEAAADLMLDLDLIAFHGRPARDTGLLHAYRYYAERWGWPKTRVEEAWVGKEERVRGDGRVVAGVEPWIGGRIAGWRRFFQELPPDSANHAPDSANQKPARLAQKRGVPTTRRTAPTTRRTNKNRPPDHQNQSGGDARARPPSGDCFEAPAVVAYQAVTDHWPAIAHAEAIARRFADADPTSPAGATLLTAWAEHVTTYHVSPTRNADNIPGMIRTLDEHLARIATDPVPHTRPGSDGRGAGASPDDYRSRRQADLDDPAAAHQRNLAAARAALGLGAAGVASPSDG